MQFSKDQLISEQNVISAEKIQVEDQGFENKLRIDFSKIFLNSRKNKVDDRIFKKITNNHQGHKGYTTGDEGPIEYYINRSKRIEK